jgi:hypothetical protein
MNPEDSFKNKHKDIIDFIQEETINMDFLISGMASRDVIDQFEDYPSIGMEIQD